MEMPRMILGTSGFFGFAGFFWASSWRFTGCSQPGARKRARTSPRAAGPRDFFCMLIIHISYRFYHRYRSLPYLGDPFIHNQDPRAGFALLVFGAAAETGPFALVCFMESKPRKKI
jgi:hypothetical protein